MFKRMILCTAVLGSAFNPAHANFSCSGNVGMLAVDSSSQLLINNGYGAWYVCTLTGAELERCKAWYAGALASQKVGQKVRLWFNSTSTGDNGANCTALGSWVFATPYFVDFMTD
jgi:hypothetical protein